MPCKEIIFWFQYYNIPWAGCSFLLVADSSTDAIICKRRERSASARRAVSDAEPKTSPAGTANGILWGVKSCAGDPKDNGVPGAVCGRTVPTRWSKLAAAYTQWYVIQQTKQQHTKKLYTKLARCWVAVSEIHVMKENITSEHLYKFSTFTDGYFWYQDWHRHICVVVQHTKNYSKIIKPEHFYRN